jgi:hypothetical protein
MISRVCSLIKMAQPERNRGLLFASGSTVPTDGTDGYQTGCIFQYTSGGVGTSLYVNEGSVTSCAFNAIEPLESITLSDLADQADGFATRLLETGTYANTASSGVVLSSSNTRPMTLLTDDGGLNLDSGNYRPFLSRTLLTIDQTGSTITPIRGQLKLNDLIDVSTGIYAPVQGYIEVAGTSISKSGATLSCISASLEITTALTAASGGEVAGIHIETTGAGTLTATGTVAGLLIDKASGAADWPVGISVLNSATAISVGTSTTGLNFAGVTPTCIYVTGVGTTSSHVIDMVDAYVGKVIETGTYASAVDKGITLSSSNFRPVTFVFDDGGDVLGAANYRAVLSRVYLGATQTGQVAIRAMRGQIKVADAIDINIATNEMNAINGVEGYIELSGSTAKTIGANTRVAAVHGLVEVNQDITLTTGGKLVGLYAELSQVTAKSVGGVGTAGVLIDRLDPDHSTNQALWTTGLMVAAGSCTTAIAIGADAGGMDCKYFGGTASHYMLWDASEDRLEFFGGGFDGGAIGIGSWGTPIVQSTGGDNLVKLYAENQGTTGITTQPLWVYSRLGYQGTTVSSVMSIVGAIEVKAGTTANASTPGQYLYGVQGRAIVDGTVNGSEIWMAGVAAEVRETSGTYTAFKYMAPIIAYSNIQSSVIGGGIYAGVIVGNAGGQAYDYGFLFHEMATVGLGILPIGAAKTMTSGVLIDATSAYYITNAIELVDNASMTNFLKTGAAGGCVTANTHSIDSHALQHVLVVEIGGDTGYIPVFAANPA